MNRSAKDKNHNQLAQYLRLHGWDVVDCQNHTCPKHLKVDTRITDLTCDAIAIRNGRTVFIEFKMPKQKLKPHQKKFGRQLLSEGIEYVVIRTEADCDSIMAGTYKFEE